MTQQLAEFVAVWAVRGNAGLETVVLDVQNVLGSHVKPSHKSLPNSLNLSFGTIHHTKAMISVKKRQVSVQAAYRDEGTSSAGVFIGGFVLGGIIVGTLGCVFAPQISKVLAGTDRKDLMRRLPKFIYDEEKALEKTRKILTEKIAQLNSAIDDVSSQLRADDDPNGAVVASDEIEASV
ncbi:hypothetical protein MA16_Dca019200 [Dendrobium catenatum]|uniref:Localized to the inner membrane of the chloroplast n=1 Tax=Dendrobium catenatum TaxID=906689 RepID=A0A2I0WKC5_9ASPA|nr:hypothetical protein MA16_Dca019200 [Dendrobium catenatum]